MSTRPDAQFEERDIVTVRDEDPKKEGGYMGVVKGDIWQPFLRSYSYEYTCQYMTYKMKGSNTIWIPVVKCTKFADELDIGKVGREPDSQGNGGESPWPRAGIEARY